jgi:gliding motility-associated lipoprotein GldH
MSKEQQKMNQRKCLSIPVVIIALFLCTACNPNRVFEEHHGSFKQNRWHNDEPVQFTVHVEDTVSEHKLYAALRHVHGYQFTTMKIYVDVTTPSGKSVTKGYELQITGVDGEYLSDCAGDICDLEVLLEDHVRFAEPGDWEIVVFCDMDRPYVPNVMEFGVIIDKYPADVKSR